MFRLPSSHPFQSRMKTSLIRLHLICMRCELESWPNTFGVLRNAGMPMEVCPDHLLDIWAILNMHSKSRIWKLSAVLEIYDFVNTHTCTHQCVCVCSKYATNFKLICKKQQKIEMGAKRNTHTHGHTHIRQKFLGTCFISRRIIEARSLFKFTQNLLRDFRDGAHFYTTHIST